MLIVSVSVPVRWKPFDFFSTTTSVAAAAEALSFALTVCSLASAASTAACASRCVGIAIGALGASLRGAGAMRPVLWAIAVLVRTPARATIMQTREDIFPSVGLPLPHCQCRAVRPAVRGSTRLRQGYNASALGLFR